MNSIKEEELITRIKNGDILAFENLVRQYERRILGFLKRYIFDEMDREDLAQDIFFSIYTNINKIDTDRSFSGFIFTVSKNKAISFLRTRKKHLPIELAEEISTDVDIYSSVLENDQNQELKNYINELPDKYRRVILLYYYEDLTYEEISAKLNIPINTVRTLLSRAKNKLRKVLI